jgi:hypothetical protein
MANISSYAQKLMLDFCLNGQSAPRPAAWGIGLSLGNPSSTAGSEIGAGSGYTRAAGSFSAAASPAGTTKNAAAATFGPFSTAQAISGILVMDTTAAGAGNQLWQGLLATARTVAPLDQLVLNVDALTISLS